MKYYDPMFYLCSDDMPFSIRIETTLKYEIDGGMLESAVNTAITRYPYFSVKIINKGGNLITVPNSLPIKVYKGKLPYPLGSNELNGHILALTYSGKKINFHITHVLTDGAGFTPFIKTVLYYYLCQYLKTELASTGIRLAGDDLFADEIGNPYPEEKMKSATAFYLSPEKEYFRISDGGYVTDDIRTAYYFRVRQADVMKFSHENDASPCALFSSLMSEAVRGVHPDEHADLVSAISFNMRPALGIKYNYRMLCNALTVRYPFSLHGRDISKICTCTRGAISIQSQPENALFYAEQKKNQLEALLELPDVKSKKEILSAAALKDSVDNTFSISYVGRVDYGALEPHIESIRNCTDGSTYKAPFIEIASFGEWFYIVLLQGFSSNVYYKSLLSRLSANGIEYEEEGCVPMDTAEIALPL